MFPKRKNLRGCMMVTIILKNSKKNRNSILIFIPIVPHIIKCISLHWTKLSKLVAFHKDVVEENLLELKKKYNVHAEIWLGGPSACLCWQNSITVLLSPSIITPFSSNIHISKYSLINMMASSSI